jgi:hypothetical protein
MFKTAHKYNRRNTMLTMHEVVAGNARLVDFSELDICDFIWLNPEWRGIEDDLLTFVGRV